MKSGNRPVVLVKKKKDGAFKFILTSDWVLELIQHETPCNVSKRITKLGLLPNSAPGTPYTDISYPISLSNTYSSHLHSGVFRIRRGKKEKEVFAWP